MTSARCTCGAVTLSLAGTAVAVVACHCLDCQRRTGAPFGVGAFYPAAAVTVSGTPRTFIRRGTSGGKVHSHFCPDCGSTLYWQADALPAMVGVAVGVLADPSWPAHGRSVFEQSKHGWIEIPAAEHFPQGSVARG